MRTLETSGGIPRARALLTTHPQYGDLTPTQYEDALMWMRELGLLEDPESPLPVAHRILSHVFERGTLPWLPDADELVRSPEELPSDIVDFGDAIGLSSEQVFDQLMVSWGKADTAARERVGAAGEAALVELLRDSTTGSVDHVSLWSDGYGFDIAFERGGLRLHFEVKSTTRTGRLTLYLSRHEYDVMLRDPCWVLVVVRLSGDHAIEGLGSVERDWIMESAPTDRGPFGAWASVKLEVPREMVVDGVPRLDGHVTTQLPGW